MEINKFSRPNTFFGSRLNPRKFHNTYIVANQQPRDKTKFHSTLSGATQTYKCESVRKMRNEGEDSKIQRIKQRCFNSGEENQIISISQVEDWHDETEQGTASNLDDQTEIQTRENRKIHLRPSKFKGRPATVHFQYSNACGQVNQPNNQQIFAASQAQMRYKLHGWQYKCIINSLEYNGFKPSETADDWAIYFDIYADQKKRIETLNKFQKFSHFPGCWHMGRKDSLWRSISKSKRSHPNQYDFIPLTYLLPTDFNRFNLAQEASPKGCLWIMKPADSACGRGIRMVAKDTEIKNRKNYLISEYISNPHLINNLKYDLRVYVVVTSYDPLRIYMFQNGLARFATLQYNCKHKDIKKRYVHLTNYSVNKHSKKFVKNQNEDGDSVASKWSLEALRKHYQKMGIDSEQVFKDVEDVVIKTCISNEANMLDMHTKTQQRRTSCFELYGFDILIDSNLKPWLIEVNICPSLSSSSPIDRKIKHTLITDLLNLIGIQIDPSKSKNKSQKALKESLWRTGKKIYSRNIKNLEILSLQNCFDILSPEDWLVLLESEEQLDRTGHFKRIFPLADNIDRYRHLFDCSRYWNCLLWKQIQSRKSFLSRIVID